MLKSLDRRRADRMRALRGDRTRGRKRFESSFPPVTPDDVIDLAERKSGIISLRAASIAALAAIVATAFGAGCDKSRTLNHAAKVPAARESVTFITGEDKSAANPYYRHAEKYYRQDATESTTRVITWCRSLADIREYLSLHRTKQDQPWALINIVSHGSPWTGLSLPVRAGGERTTAGTLRDLMESGEWSELPAGSVDAATIVRVRGCGAGADRDFASALAGVLSADDARPLVEVSPLYEAYESSEGKIRRYQAKTWYAFHPEHIAPNPKDLAATLRRKNPKVEIDWSAALARTRPDAGGIPYTRSYTLPLEFLAPCDRNRQAEILESSRRGLKWALALPAIRARLEELNLPADAFTWNLAPAPQPGGTAAIAVTARARVVCVLREAA